MIRIDFVEPQSKTWKRWRNACRKATEQLLADFAAGKPLKIREKLYRRKSVKDQFYMAKQGPFRGKCAYCECYLKDFQHGDMEHFRPKLGVTDENDVSIEYATANGRQIHPGYFWLAYDARNLLPACVNCNQPTLVAKRKIGKHNRFPVVGQHAVDAAGVATEQPLLINPIEEDPAKHLTVDTNTGLMVAVAGSTRGQACEKIFGLNDRERLPQERRQVMDALRYHVTKFKESPDPHEQQSSLDAIKIAISGTQSFTAAARSIWSQLRKTISSQPSPRSSSAQPRQSP